MIILGCLLERNQVFKEVRRRTCRIGGTKLGNINDLSLCDFEKNKEDFSGKNISFCPFCGNNLYSDVEQIINISSNPDIKLMPLDLNEDKWVVGFQLNPELNSTNFSFTKIKSKMDVQEALTSLGLWDENRYGLIEFSERDR